VATATVSSIASAAAIAAAVPVIVTADTAWCTAELADRSPRLARLSGTADVAEDLGVHGQLERPHRADGRSRRRPGLGVHEHAGGSLAGGCLCLSG
jgi:hypothetical protein